MQFCECTMARVEESTVDPASLCGFGDVHAYMSVVVASCSFRFVLHLLCMYRFCFLFFVLCPEGVELYVESSGVSCFALCCAWCPAAFVAVFGYVVVLFACLVPLALASCFACFLFCLLFAPCTLMLRADNMKCLLAACASAFSLPCLGCLAGLA